jgi:DNA-binding XRE family transcriptional regulator
MSGHTDPQARSWEDLKQELFTAAERDEIDAGAQQLVAEVRAFRLAEVRRRQRTTQVELAKAMGVTQARYRASRRGSWNEARSTRSPRTFRRSAAS